jgi:hypothetical protein
MASFTKINSFVEKLAEKTFNLQSDTLTLALTNTAHTSTWTQLSDLTQVSYTNLSSRVLTVSSSAQTSGTYKLVINDITLTSTGGSTGPFRYVYIYDDTATNDELIGYYDYGSSLTLGAGESLTVDFDGTNGVLTIA